MLWHLVDPTGASLRTCEASCLAEARRLLRPIPADAFVASDASHRLGYHPGVSYEAPRRVENTPAQTRAADDMRTREAVRKGVANRWTDVRIAEVAGVTPERVRQVRTRLGLPGRMEQVRREVAALLREGLPEVQIAERLEVTRQYVADVRNREGLEKPKKQPRKDPAQLSIWGKRGMNIRLGRAS